MVGFSRLSTSIARFSLSLRAQLALFAFVALLVPLFLYAAFRAADQEKTALLLDAVRGQDVVLAKALAPQLANLGAADFGRLTGELARLAAPETNLKLLYKPDGLGGESGFFLVASAPAATPNEVAAERKSLVDLGILDRLSRSCDGGEPLSERVALSGERREMLTSVAPFKTKAGCWILVVAVDSRSLIGDAGSRPYWRRPAVTGALAVYGVMALLAIVVVRNVWRALSGFRAVARGLDRGSSFARTTHIPELAPIADDLDRMVERLNNAATHLRNSAEDTAHAFKTPIATIRQSLEVIRRRADSNRVSPALDAIGLSLDKLDGLVRSARQLDVAAADLLGVNHHRVDLSALLVAFAAEYRLMLGDRAQLLDVAIAQNLFVIGREELVETILENLIDNALGFSPPQGRVSVRLEAENGFAKIAVSDRGPGVAPERLETIFERYYSHRPSAAGAAADQDDHHGVGLWVVGRNAVAMGGRATAKNRPGGGLEVTVVVPLTSGGSLNVQEKGRGPDSPANSNGPDGVSAAIS